METLFRRECENHVSCCSYSCLAIQAIQDKYSSLGAIPGPGFEVQFEGDTIRLAIPEDGVSLQNGWEITPLIAPLVSSNICSRD